jgi:predicted outer membrane repeat protein
MVHANTVYIRSDGPSDGDGKSWKTAFSSIDAAIANLQYNPADTTFWVAAGVYSPVFPYSPNGVVGGAAGDDFPIGLLTFDLPDGVQIYGGFKGCEKSLSERPTVPNPMRAVDQKCSCKTKLAKEVVDYGLTVLDGGGSDSWHVVTVGNDIALTGANVGLFDLTIRGGYADGPDAGTLDSLFSIATLDYAHDTGGGIYARFGSIVDINNVQFINNAASGVNGTVFGSLGEPLISGGGAISAFDTDTTINVTNSYFTYNSEIIFGGGGGGIASNFNASLNVADSYFANNVANRSGGAIRAKDGGDVNVSGCFFTRNLARDLNPQVFLDQSAGAIDTLQGNLYVKCSTFIDNEAQTGPGAIFFHTFLDDGTPYFFDVNECVFEDNVAGPFGGGAILVFGTNQHVGSKATIRNSQFTKNRGGLGGAIYNSSYDTEITNNSFCDNLADAWGGAIAADNFGDALFFTPFPFAQRLVTKIVDCTFDHNKTRGTQPIPIGYPPFYTPQGVLNLFAEVAPVINGIPTQGTVDQTIQSGGGAIAVILAGVAEIDKCKFKYNEAKHGTGGAILVGGVTGTVTNLDTGDTFQTFDYATAVVKDCKFKCNRPNKAKAVDLAGVGTGPDGITLIIEK